MGKSDRSQSQRNLVALIVVATFACLAAGSPAARAADPDVDELFQRMQKAMWPGKDMRARFEARVVSALGEHAYITGSYYRRGETPEPTLQRFVIDSPIALQGFELAGKSDGGKPMELHIYVPAVRRVRRIHLDMRKESFLATDFNFEDLGFEDVALGKSVVRRSRARRSAGLSNRDYPRRRLAVREDRARARSCELRCRFAPSTTVGASDCARSGRSIASTPSTDTRRLP